MVKLAGVFSKFKPRKILLIGDFMLDKYTTGKIERISPEAPVSVLHVLSDRSQPGGAGNVVLNMIALKAEVVSVGRIGEDQEGVELKKSLKDAGSNVDNLMVEKGYLTPTKNRLIASSQQILRVDREEVTSLLLALEKKIIEKLPSLIDGAQVIAISDYAKGFLTNNLLREIIKNANSAKIPVIVDPKGLDFSKYKNCFMIKPNLSEAYRAANLPRSESLEKVAEVLFEKTNAENLLITRSEDGITVFDKSMIRKDYPVRSKEVQDVTGAGDTVLAMLSVCLANNFDMDHTAQLANIAAGIAIERLGCAKVTLTDLAKRLFELDIGNKIFEESHLFAFHEVLKETKFNVLGVDSSKGMSTALLKAILKLSSTDKHKLVVYIKDEDPKEDFISLLSSLNSVHFIVLKKQGLKSLFKKINSEETYQIVGNKLKKLSSEKMFF